MILYIPTNEAESLLEMLENFGDKRFNPSWLYDMKEQIREQMRSYKMKTITLEEALKKELIKK